MKHLAKMIKQLTAALPLLIALPVLVALFGCSDPVSSPSCVLNISIVQDTDGRALVPTNVEFSKYVLSFRSLSGLEEPEDLLVDAQTGAAEIMLAQGRWEISATGHVMIGDIEYEAASGKETIVIDFSREANPSLAITLSATIEGDSGFFAWEFIFPSEKVNSVMLNFGKFPDGPFRDIYDEDYEGGPISYSPGYYLLSAELANENQAAGRVSIVHIYSGLLTTARIELSAVDFSDFITLSGTAQILGGTHDAELTVEARTSGSDTTPITLIGTANVASNGAWLIKSASFSATTVYFWVYEDGELVYIHDESGVTGTTANIAIIIDERVEYYSINIESANSGVTVNPAGPVTAGTEITITVEPVGHFELSALSVTDADGQPVPVDADNIFVMPASDVTVSAEFVITFTELVIDFEDAVWAGSAYATRTVNWRDHEWTVGGVLNHDNNDRFEGERSIRMRDSGHGIEQVTWFSTGIQSISFNYASYSTHRNGVIVLSYQVKGGEWEEAGRVTAPQWNNDDGAEADMLSAHFDINQIDDEVRFRILKGNSTSSSSVNVDNIVVTYPGVAEVIQPPAPQNPGTGSGALGSDALTIHFLELGNKYTGDSVYINYGDIDILIDAGSKQSSAATITAYINNYIQDGKLEYVIATHAHEDHIAGFSSTSTTTGIFDSYEIGTIIDFPQTNSTSNTYRNYVNARTAAVGRGAVHYTALQCYNNEGGAQRIYDLGGGVYLEILYNPYYVLTTSGENNYSVCARIIDNGNQMLFTGDMEQLGENAMVTYYQTNHGGLGHHVLFHGAHHGSNTSNQAALLAAITPDFIVFTAGVGSDEYGANPDNTYPTQRVVNTIAPYTDKVYATTIVPDYANNVFGSFNGNIIFSATDGVYGIQGSNNNTKLKDTDWFKANRTTPDAWK